MTRAIRGVAQVIALCSLAMPGVAEEGRDQPLKPGFSGIVRVAAVQTYPRLFDTAYNRSVILSKAESAAQNGAKLVVFPELQLTGYKFKTTAEAALYSEEVPGPSTDQIVAKAQELGIYIAFGMIERAPEGIFDSVVLVGPEGLLGSYRKIHQGFQSEGLVFTRGNRIPPVFSTRIGRIGLGDCYDGAFPETARILGVQGADILVFPYNENGTIWRDYVRSRGVENTAYVIAAARIGSERFSSYNGLSLVADQNFRILAEANSASETTVFADLDLSLLEKSRFGERRPELYATLSALPPPQILSGELNPAAHVTGNAQDVAISLVNASIPAGSPAVIQLLTTNGLPLVSSAGETGYSGARLALSIPSDVPAGEYTVHVSVDPGGSIDLPYVVKSGPKPVPVGILPTGPGASVKSTLYVSFDMAVAANSKVAVKLVGPTSTTTLYGSINTAGVDNRLSVSYPTLLNQTSYTAVVPAGSVRSTQFGTVNDEIRFSFVTERVPVSVKAAVVQFNPQHLALSANLAAMLAKLDEAASNGAKVVVFPELASTGSQFTDKGEALGVAERIPGPTTNAMAARAASRGIYAAFGMLEKDPGFCGNGNCDVGPGRPWDLYSTMVLVGPGGLVGKHRKTQLAPGEAGLLKAGAEPSEVYDTPLAKIGLALCHEYFFPEVGRSTVLEGAEIIATGCGASGTLWMEMGRTRGSESKFYFVAANRVGSEGSATFGGGSLMSGSLRKIVAQAGTASVETIYGLLNLDDLKKRRSLYVDRATAKVRGTDQFGDRRPELYGILTDYHSQSTSAPLHKGFDYELHDHDHDGDGTEEPPRSQGEP